MALFEKLVREPEAELVGRELLSKLRGSGSVSLGPLGDEAKRSLDSLYTIETVDVKSIRRIGEREKQPVKVASPEALGVQPFLPLGGRFREARPSFVLAEPVHVLGLSQHLEKLLIEGGKRRLGDLYRMKSHAYLEVKGLGQGHIDEVVTKLKQYLSGKVLENSAHVDFAAILRSLAVFVSSVPLAAASGLSHLIPLTAAEKAELKRKQEAREGDLEACRPSLQFALKEVAEVYLIPWMERRGGIATKSELLERVESISLNGEETFSILRFFEEEFSLSLFDECIPLEDSLFATDAYSSRRFGKVIEAADSYFNVSSTLYRLDQLVEWLTRDFARVWEGEEPSYIKRALRLWPRYRVWIGLQGLEIGLRSRT